MLFVSWIKYQTQFSSQGIPFVCSYELRTCQYTNHIQFTRYPPYIFHDSWYTVDIPVKKIYQPYSWLEFSSCTNWYGSLSHYLQGFSTIPKWLAKVRIDALISKPIALHLWNTVPVRNPIGTWFCTMFLGEGIQFTPQLRTSIKLGERYLSKYTCHTKAQTGNWFHFEFFCHPRRMPWR